MRADDAERAVEHGVDAIIVSNHGGRQLDHAQASIEALPAIAEAVGDRAELYLDSGVRRGTDIIKALALGARAVLVGPPARLRARRGGRGRASAARSSCCARSWPPRSPWPATRGSRSWDRDALT